MDYKGSGVNVTAADNAISGIVTHIKRTWPTGGPHQVLLDIGYFANVIDIGGGMGIAMCTDGVGSKTIICEQMQTYDYIGIDCVAMNVNDLLCVGATPLSMTDYIAVDSVRPTMLERIGMGLAEGARQARISICGGELSQISDIVRGFDLTGAATGIVNLRMLNTGKNVAVGDVIIGIESNGIHSNGLTLARKVFLAAGTPYRTPHHDLGMSLGAELLRPTYIYVPEVIEILGSVPVKALAHITGDGLLNLLRIDREDTGFVIDHLPPPPPIFTLIQKTGQIDDATMFETFNMGIGFCIVVSPPHDYTVMEILGKFNRRAWRIGHTIRDFQNTIHLPQYALEGTGKSFRKIEPEK